jgi:hypothetical protein
LPVEYFHAVFTLPAEIADIALQNKKAVYNLLFQTAAKTLRTIAADPKHLGAEIGLFAILHTWGQNLRHHPHLHCVVPGGGLAPGGEKWAACRPGFFLPVRVLSRLFRRLFLKALRKAYQQGQLRFHGNLDKLRKPPTFNRYLAPLRKRQWVVYAKPPFGGPEQVLEYLGRYTHRVAISNQRLVACDEGTVSFTWKDYRHQDRQKVMTLDGGEFLRRFLLHALPPGFQRIRHYGLFANRHRRRNLTRCRCLLAACGALPADVSGQNSSNVTSAAACLRRCPACGATDFLVVEVLTPAWSFDSS